MSWNDYAAQCQGWKPSSCSLQSFPYFQMNSGARSRMSTRHWCQTSRLQTLNLKCGSTLQARIKVDTDDLCTLLEHSKSVSRMMFTPFSKFCWPCPFNSYRRTQFQLPTWAEEHHDRNKTVKSGLTWHGHAPWLSIGLPVTSGFPTFINNGSAPLRQNVSNALPMRWQSHQGGNTCDVSMVSLVARWPAFWPIFDLRICSRTANPINTRRFWQQTNRA